MPFGECFQTFLSHGWLPVEDHSIVVDSGDASDFLKLVLRNLRGKDNADSNCFEPPIDLLGSVREGALNLPVEFQIPVEPYYYSQKFHVLLIGIW
jgi:hypothetical protein